MDSTKSYNTHSRRDSSDSMDSNGPYSTSTGHLLFVFFTLLLLASLCSLALFILRRKRLAKKQSMLPTYHRAASHHRSPSVSNFNTGKNESIFVYDEKMNLIHNSSSRPTTPIPEIHITFPDEEGNAGSIKKGRVVIVHVTDSGSVGMGPVGQENLPPYQQEDADRFQSLDLERMGGLKEKESLDKRWS